MTNAGTKSSTTPPEGDAVDNAKSEPSAFARFLSEFLEAPLSGTALAMLLIIVALAVLAPWIAPQNPYDLASLDVMDSRLPPGSALITGATAWLGTDGAGRDLLSAMLYGLRISLAVGIASGLIAMALGAVVGLVAAYSGGRGEAAIMRVIDMQLSFPAILIALMLIAVLGKGIDKIIIALVTVQWAYYARTVRASALAERGKDYVEAARCLGLPPTRILFGHILPNCLAPLIVVAAVQTAHAIALEATLSFLGVGLPQTEPSLGLLIANGYEFMLSGKYWISFFPGLLLLVTIMTINLVGDRLREVLNPRLRR